MIENDTLVRHKILGYEGLIDGQTRLKLLFTGERGCEYQYRIKILGQEKRYVAPEEDLEIGNKDKEKEMQSKFKKARLKTRVKVKLVIVFFAIILFASIQLSYADGNSFSVNIPNAQSGYTAIVIQ